MEIILDKNGKIVQLGKGNNIEDINKERDFPIKKKINYNELPQEELERLAKQKDCEAILNIAFRRQHGLNGFNKNIGKAIKCYEIAEKLGYKEARTIIKYLSIQKQLNDCRPNHNPSSEINSSKNLNLAIDTFNIFTTANDIVRQ